MNSSRPVPLFLALIPIFFLIIFLAANVIIFGDSTLEGSNQIILLLAATLAGLIGFSRGMSWQKIQEAILKQIGKAMPAILILLLIGSLAGTWLISGVVPALVYYGLKIIHPKVFLLTAIVVSALVSLATGSSWSTIATIGVALLGIGTALGLHEGLVAGAIISGAYFGDKMSPLSDTTNLAPAVAGTDLFTHIRYMTITTVPSLIIALIIFIATGLLSDFSDASQNVDAVIAAVEQQFYISPVLLLVPIILIIVIIRKVPPVPALIIGTLLGAIFAVIFQAPLIHAMAPSKDHYLMQSYRVVLEAMYGDISIKSNNIIVAKLLNTSGMRGMLNTVWLILSAMIFGGVMEASGFLVRISTAIMSMVRSTGSLILSTISTSIFFNLTASDQYISIVVPGQMYAKNFKEQHLKPEVLSRTLEDGGTLTSVLIPWNTCGATQSKVLGVSTWTYLPYCFFNLVNPIVAVTIGYLGYKIRKFKPGEEEEGKE